MSKIKVEQFVAKIDELTPTENNPRQISKQDFENLKRSMKEFPEMREIRKVVVDESNRILGGHMRIKALKELGESEVPVDKVYGLTEKQKQRFVIQDNIQNGEWDMDELANSWSDLPLDDWGIGVEWDTSEQEVVEDEVPEVDENEPADSELGVVYQLGRHRLMCGDSTDAGSVAILMNGQKADMVFTDPPYGVSYAEKNKFLNSIDEKQRITHAIENDSKPPEEMYELWTKTFKNMFDVTSDKMSYYISGPQGGDLLLQLLSSIIDAGFMLKHTLIWVKNNHVFGRTDYNYRHEPIAYGWKPNGTHNFYATFDTSVFEDELNIDKLKKDEALAILKELLSDKVPTDVIHESRPLKSDLHPTMKPVKLLARLISNSSRKDELVLDLFGGSGSTLIACEQLDRICHMMELDPKYCDVIRKRYWKFVTGSEEGWQEGTKEAK